LAIPVVIRHGDISATGRLTEFDLVGPKPENNNKPALEFVATREGNASTLGEVRVLWAENGNDFEEIAMITNFNVFPEIDRRKGAVPLDVAPTSGKLKIIYTDTQTDTMYDEVTIDL
jgi:hypothetical protein